nr:type II secretion system protein [Wenzhouxiangella limi]
MRGFTLMEMMVVMAIIALAVGIVLPRLDAMVSSYGAAAERETVIEAIAALGVHARAEGERITFAGQNEWLQGEIPPHWHIEADPAIVFHPSGACDGGLIQLRGRDRRFTYRLEPPRCRAILVD